MYDGAIVFNTRIDNSNVAKDLEKTKREIEKSTESIQKNQNAKMPLVKQAEELSKKLNEAKQNLEAIKAEMKAAETAMGPGASAEDHARASADLPRLKQAVKESEKEVAALQKQWDTVNNKVDAYDLKIRQAQNDIDRNTAKAAQLSAQMNSTGAKAEAAFAKARASADKFRKKILQVGASMIMFRVFSAILQGVGGYMNKILQTNAEYTAQLAKLKGALMTAFQPIYEFILPGLLTVLRVLTAIVSVAARVLSALFGTSASQSAQNAENLNNEAEAIGGVGDAAKKAKKELAGFDEINILGSPDTSGGGGGGGAATAPDFEGIADVSESLTQILGLVLAIGAGLLTWSIAKAFTDNMNLAAGLAMTVGGAIMYAFNWADALENGIDWDNFSGMLVGMLVVVGGLALAFGSVGAAIGALVTGIGMIIVSLSNFMKTGELTDEMLTAIAVGVLAIGAGISLLTGSWIPLAIAGVVSLVAILGTQFDFIKNDILTPLVENLVSAWGYIITGAEDMFKAIKQVFTGIAQFIAGVLKGSIKDAVNGIITILNGFISAFYATINTIIRGINSISIKIPDWVPEFGGETWGPNLEILTPPQIPLLAQGAVLPANKPFLAVVGDQKNGTNIEAPLKTIEEALANVLAAQGTGDVTVNITGDLAPFVRWLNVEIDREKKRTGRSLAAGNI